MINILLGEDDSDDSMLFIQAVSESNIASVVNVAENGALLLNQLKCAETAFPDIIFLDINMPLKNGLECLEEIRSEPRFKDIPVIIYSTSADKKEIEICYEKGANCYVVKPFSFEAISKMVNDLCTRNWQIKSDKDISSFVVSYE